jgi:hypothetical protein
MSTSCINHNPKQAYPVQGGLEKSGKVLRPFLKKDEPRLTGYLMLSTRDTGNSTMGRERTMEDRPAGRPPLTPAFQPVIFKVPLVKPANTSSSPIYIRTGFAGCVKGKNR